MIYREIGPKIYQQVSSRRRPANKSVGSVSEMLVLACVTYIQVTQANTNISEKDPTDSLAGLFRDGTNYVSFAHDYLEHEKRRQR